MAKISWTDLVSDEDSSIATVQRRLARNGLNVSQRTFHPNPGRWMGASALTVILHETAPVDLGWRPSGEQGTRLTATPGCFHIKPFDQPVFSDWQGQQGAIVVTVKPSFLEWALGGAFDGKTPELLAKAALQDPVIVAMIDVLRRGLREQEQYCGLILDHAGAMLALHLFERYGLGSRIRILRNGGLGGYRRRRIIDFIEAHLGEDLNLNDLAIEAGLSPDHFSKAFKASLGTPPWQYVSARRILRAKDMLLNSNLSLTEIALDLGFASHSHFSDVFRKVTGVTPSRFRRRDPT